MSLPSTAYNTLPAHVHQMRSSPRVISGSSSSSKKASSQYHKRSPSSDSGTGSNTPVSSYHSGKVHHTVYLHGKSKIRHSGSTLFFLFPIFDLIFKLGLTTFPVGPKSGGSSDTSPPLQSFAEESSPENLMRNGQSTESLDSLSDESGGVHHHSRSHNRSSSGAEIRPRNVRPSPRQVRKLQ